MSRDRKIRPARLAAILALASYGIAGSALAQPTEITEAPESPGVTTGIDEVIVQAQKRAESVQTVPIAVTAISGAMIEKQFAVDLKSFAGMIPNVSLENDSLSPFTASFYIRGMGIQARESFVDPAVAVVNDGVYQARASNALSDLHDVEAIEILRGPQGTLQGLNATAGAVLVRHFKPDSSGFAAKAAMSYGSFSRIGFEGMVNVPLVDDTLAVRVSAKTVNSSGPYFNRYSESKLSEQNHVNLLPSIRFTRDNLDITVRGEYSRTRDDASVLLPYNYCPVDPRIVAARGTLSGANDRFTDLVTLALGAEEGAKTCARDPDKSSYVINQDRNYGEFNDYDVWGIGGTIDYTIDDIGTITYVGNYRDSKTNASRDADATALNIFNARDLEDHYQTSHELRFASDFSEFVDFVAGGIVLKQEFSARREQFNQGRNFFLESGQEDLQWGLFGQANWHFTDSLTLVTGIRYTSQTKDFVFCPSGPTDCDVPGRTSFLGSSWSNISPRVGLNYQAADNLFFYAYWASGFRSGGYNGNAGSLSAVGPFNPEKIGTYEFGVKWDAFDNRLRLNAAAFWTDAKNLQRNVSRESPSGSVEVVTTNAASARIRGIELELTAVPMDGLTIQATAGYLDAAYRNYCADLNGAAANHPSLTPCGPRIGSAQPVDLTGLPLTRSPKLTSQLSATYEHEAFNSGFMSWNLQWIHESKQLTTEAGYPTGTTLGMVNYDGSIVRPSRGATNRVNASLSWRDYDERYRLSVFVKNLTNEIYIQRTSVVAGLWNFIALNEPRTWGVQAEFKF